MKPHEHGPLAYMFLFALKHSRFCTGCLIILLLLSAFVLAFSSYSADLFALFPAQSQTRKTLNEIQQCGMLNRVTVYLSLPDGRAFEGPGSLRFLEPLTRTLKNSPDIREVLCRKDSLSPVEMMKEELRYLPQYCDPEQLDLGESAMNQRMTGLMRQLLLLPPGVPASILTWDPLSLSSARLRKAEDFLAVSGFHADSLAGAFVSPDRTKCLMILTTAVSGSDFQGCRRLLDFIRKIIREQAPGIKADIFSVHTHTLDNEQGIRRDLLLFGVMTALIFTLLFAVIYRGDWRGLTIPILAGAAGVLGTAGLSLFFPHILVFTIGLGGILIGLGVDYGIHLYAASMQKHRIREALRLMSPLCFAFLTTGAAFFCFLFSGVPLFAQFGVFALLTLGLTFFLMIWILPGLLFRRHRGRQPVPLHIPDSFWQHPRMTTAAGIIAGLLLLTGIFLVHIDLNIKNFDLANQLHGKEEQACRNAFFKEGHPVPVLYRDIAVMKNDLCMLRKQYPEFSCTGASDFLLPEHEKKANLEHWKLFLASPEYPAFKQRFNHAAEKAGFDEEFFRDFFTVLESSVQNPPAGESELNRLMMSSLGSAEGGSLLMLPPGTDTGKMADVLHGVILDEKVILDQVFRDLTENLPWIASASLLLILLLIRIHTGSLHRSLLALVPLAASLIAVAGIHGLTGTPLSLAVLFSCIICAGIAVDYGILILDSGEKYFSSMISSITFSAITTIAGGLTVIFARHPMLHAAGLTVVTGITAAWAAGLFLLPLLMRWNWKKMFPLAIVCLLCLTGCRSIPFEEPERLPVPSSVPCRIPPAPAAPFEASAVLDYVFGEVTFLIAGEWEGPLIGFSPAGMKLFEIQGDHFQWQKGILTPEREQQITPFLARAFRNYARRSTGTTAWRTTKAGLRLGTVSNTDSESTFLFSGPQGRLIEMRRYEKNHEIWKIFLFPDGNTENIRYIYEETGSMLRLIVRILPSESEQNHELH